MARDSARGTIERHKRRKFYGPTPIPFEAEIVEVADVTSPTVLVRVSGSAAYAGRSTFLIDPDNVLTHGFTLSRTYGELRHQAQHDAR